MRWGFARPPKAKAEVQLKAAAIVVDEPESEPHEQLLAAADDAQLVAGMNGDEPEVESGQDVMEPKDLMPGF